MNITNQAVERVLRSVYRFFGGAGGTTRPKVIRDIYGPWESKKRKSLSIFQDITGSQ